MVRLTNPEYKEGILRALGYEDNKSTNKLWLRLAAIEDILGEDYDLDHLRELAEADRDGRCVVLPVKVGDTVYDTTIEDITGEIRAMTVASEVFFRSKSFNRLDFHAENNRGAFMTFNHRDIGRSVFRTREAAEAALKGE